MEGCSTSRQLLAPACTIALQSHEGACAGLGLSIQLPWTSSHVPPGPDQEFTWTHTVPSHQFQRIRSQIPLRTGTERHSFDFLGRLLTLCNARGCYRGTEAGAGFSRSARSKDNNSTFLSLPSLQLPLHLRKAACKARRTLTSKGLKKTSSQTAWAWRSRAARPTARPGCQTSRSGPGSCGSCGSCGSGRKATEKEQSCNLQPALLERSKGSICLPDVLGLDLVTEARAWHPLDASSTRSASCIGQC